MRSATVVFAAAFAAVALSAGASRVTHGMLASNAAAMGWREVGVPDTDALISLTVGISQNEEGKRELERTLLEVSDPSNRRYGQHLSREQVDALVVPAPASVDAVTRWITTETSATITDLHFSAARDFVTVTLPVHEVETLLQTKYRKYTKIGTAQTVTRVQDYSIPADLVGHVDIVAPTVRFPTVHSAKVSSPAGVGIDPTYLRKLYNIGSVVNLTPTNKQAALGFLEQYVSTQDVATFFQNYYTPAVNEKWTILGNDTGATGIEADLDVEYIMAIGGGVPTEFWSEPGTQPYNPENEPFLAWLQQVAATPDATVPKVFSVSYGDDEDSVNQDYAYRVNTEFQKVGVRGISLMFSSGDGGVGGSQSTCKVYVPTFPAASPWVTGVGGTNVNNDKAASLSGGGFSNYFDRPDYQKTAVAKYFTVAQNLPDKSLYNGTGAGFPDVSAGALDFTIVYSGESIPVAGTSCAAPTFSGIVALLNDLRLQKGKSTLGFLNPLFYAHPEVFTDITAGNNPGCQTNGFQASAGWDPVTGLGSPDYLKMKALVESLP